MSQLTLPHHFDMEAYLAWEAEQTDKHEYLAGEVVTMPSTQREHAEVVGNLFAVLKQKLRGGPCRPYMSDMKLRVEQTDAIFTPDIMVSCDADDLQADFVMNSPTLIIEVLSDSTAAFDRGDKFAAYRSLPTLKEYVMVDIKPRRVEGYRKTAENDWLMHEYVGDGECRFFSLEVGTELSEVFDGVE